MNTLDERWKALESHLPPNFPPQYKGNLRLAFYAGADSLLKIQCAITDYSEDAKVAVMAGIAEEIDLVRASATIRAYLETHQREADQ